jgi:hypothetical protein
LPKIRPELDESGRLTGGATVESGDGGAKRVPLDAEAISGLRDRIHEGTPVFDDAEQKVGFVEGYDRETGYMHLKEGVVLQQDVFLPATTVAILDDRGIHLAVTKQAITDRFTRIPDIARHVFAP